MTFNRISLNELQYLSKEVSTLHLFAPRQEANRVECGIPNFLEICRKVYELYIQMEEFFLVQELSKHP